MVLEVLEQYGDDRSVNECLCVRERVTKWVLSEEYSEGVRIHTLGNRGNAFLWHFYRLYLANSFKNKIKYVFLIL